jgi:peptidoglycan hydrolase-like protein with peptidoglycan-binding domain
VPSAIAQLYTTDNLQTALNGFGYAPVLSVNGQYNAATKAAVEWFQAKHSLPADGLPGPKTWAAIDKALG